MLVRNAGKATYDNSKSSQISWEDRRQTFALLGGAGWARWD